MNLALFGPPGSGKGTQSEKLVEKFGYVHVSSGELLRNEIKSGSVLGQDIDHKLKLGELVSDELMIEMLFHYIEQFKGQSILFDGFPRTLGQARALAPVLTIDLAILLNVPMQLVLDRMSSRLVCQSCGTNFHRLAAPPTKDGICDRCGGILVVRADDQPDAMRRRYELYVSQTREALSFYKNLGRMVALDGALDPGQVFLNVCQALEEHGIKA